MTRRAVLTALALVPVISPLAASQAPPIAGLLDQYQAGAFDAAVRSLAGETDELSVRAAFTQDAAAWIARVPADLPRRRFVAVTLALEVAHARLARNQGTLIVLLDWAKEAWRQGSPTPDEHAWTLAAVALVERGVEVGHMRKVNMSRLGPITGVGGPFWGEGFIAAAVKRFPDEPRFRLAGVVRDASNLSRGDLRKLATDPVVGADALVQLAYLEWAGRKYDAAIQFARRAVEGATEPDTRYVAHFIMASCHKAQGRLGAAVTSYAEALKAVPRGQAASVALAVVLARDNQVDRAFDLVDQSLDQRPDGEDPWRLFSYGGYARWPSLIAAVRARLQ